MTNRLTILLLVTMLASGCSPQQAAEPAPAPAAPPAVVIAPAVEGPKPQTPAPPPPPPPPPPTFAFPADRAGQALPRVLAPDVSRPLPTERLGLAPRPHTIPKDIREPGAIPAVEIAPPPVPLAKAVASAPADPPEAIPLNLGSGTHDLPAKPMLPVIAVNTPRARDAHLPPPAPALGRPADDRVPFDDPTSDYGNAAVVSDSAKTPLAPSGFLKVAVPDPFELGAQVKPKVPANAEPSVAPVVVDPERVK